MELIPEWAPNIHPMLVHFPIAILAIAIFFDFISFFMPRERKWWTEEATAFLYGVGAVTAVIVYYTGTLAADSVNASAQAEKVMGIHAGWAWWTIWFYGIYAIARIAATWWTSDRHRIKFHIGFFLLSLVGMFFLYETGEHGAKMVFGYGTGTGQLVEQQSNPMKKAQPSGYEHKGDGAISWIIGEDAHQTLNDDFTFLLGDAGSVKAAAVSKDGSGGFNFENPRVFFVTNDNSYASMQAVIAVHPGQYTGDIAIAHQVHDADNYGYLVLHSDGSAELGHVRDGEKSTVEEGSFDWQGIKRIKLSVSGNHIKGFVNGSQILHGHYEQPGPGAVGLKLNGNGTFGLRMLKITPITGEEEQSGDEAEEHQH